MPLSQLTISVSASEEKATTGTPSNPELSNVSAQILAANANRKGVTLVNTTGSTIFVALGGTATLTNSIPVPDDSIWEMPQPIYTGVISGILSSGTATPVVIELT